MIPSDSSSHVSAVPATVTRCRRVVASHGVEGTEDSGPVVEGGGVVSETAIAAAVVVISGGGGIVVFPLAPVPHADTATVSATARSASLLTMGTPLEGRYFQCPSPCRRGQGRGLRRVRGCCRPTRHCP